MFMSGDPIHQQRAQQDQQNTCKIHQRTYPAGIVKERTGKQGDYRQFRTAGHKGGQHRRSIALPLIANGTGRHHTGNGAAGADNEGNHGFAGKTHFFEDGIQHHGSTGHIAAVFQQGDKEVHHHHQRQETHHRADTTNDALRQQRSQEGIGIGAIQQAGDPFLKQIDQRYQAGNRYAACKFVTFCDPGTQPGLADLEH